MAFVALVAFFCAWAGNVVVDVLDIGQGDSILIRTPADKTILIDAGDGKIDVVPMLQSLGVTHIDLAIATHPHADHIGGMAEVIDAFPPKVYVDNGMPHTTQTYTKVMESVERSGTNYRAGVRSTVFNLDDGAKLELLNPAETPLSDTRSDLNANSVVARLTHGKDCFLFLGDAEEPTERLLLDGDVGQCDVLKVAHHGSRHSSTRAFLEAVQPKHAIISVGADNRYHHPSTDAIERLDAVEAALYRTDLMGRITITSTGEGVSFATERSATPEELRVGGDVGYVHRGDPGVVMSDGPMLPGRQLLPRGAVGEGREAIAAARAARTPEAEEQPGTPAAAPAEAPTEASGARTRPPPPGLAARPDGARPARIAETSKTTESSPSAEPGTPAESGEPVDAPADIPGVVPAAVGLIAATDGLPTPNAVPSPRADASCVFVASRRSEVFHETACGNGLKISTDNLVCYPNREAAVADGKRPAGCCHP